MKLEHEIINKEVLKIKLCHNHLDASVTTDLKNELLAYVDEHKLYQVMLDLNEVEFIDSSGLGTLLAVMRELVTKNGTLKLASLTSPVRTMVELVRLHRIMEIYNTNEAAIRSFKLVKI